MDGVTVCVNWIAFLRINAENVKKQIKGIAWTVRNLGMWRDGQEMEEFRGYKLNICASTVV